MDVMGASEAKANFPFCNPVMKQKVAPGKSATEREYLGFPDESAVWSDCSDQDYRQRAALGSALGTGG